MSYRIVWLKTHLQNRLKFMSLFAITKVMECCQIRKCYNFNWKQWTKITHKIKLSSYVFKLWIHMKYNPFLVPLLVCCYNYILSNWNKRMKKLPQNIFHSYQNSSFSSTRYNWMDSSHGEVHRTWVLPWRSKTYSIYKMLIVQSFSTNFQGKP